MFIFVLALLIIGIERGLVLTVAAVAVLSTVLWWFIVPAMMRWNIKKNIIKIKKTENCLIMRMLRSSFWMTELLRHVNRVRLL